MSGEDKNVDDEARANDAAKKVFVYTMIGTGLYIAAVIVWIFMMGGEQ